MFLSSFLMRLVVWTSVLAVLAGADNHDDPCQPFIDSFENCTMASADNPGACADEQADLLRCATVVTTCLPLHDTWLLCLEDQKCTDACDPTSFNCTIQRCQAGACPFCNDWVNGLNSCIATSKCAGSAAVSIFSSTTFILMAVALTTAIASILLVN